jgi:hypothetical protein
MVVVRGVEALHRRRRAVPPAFRRSDRIMASSPAGRQPALRFKAMLF